MKKPRITRAQLEAATKAGYEAPASFGNRFHRWWNEASPEGQRRAKVQMTAAFRAAGFIVEQAPRTTGGAQPHE